MRRLLVLTGLTTLGLVFLGFTLGWQVALLLGMAVALFGLLGALLGVVNRLLGRWSWYASKQRQRTLESAAFEVEQRYNRETAGVAGAAAVGAAAFSFGDGGGGGGDGGGGGGDGGGGGGA
jgi:hypothetical protein